MPPLPPVPVSEPLQLRRLAWPTVLALVAAAAAVLGPLGIAFALAV